MEIDIQTLDSILAGNSSYLDLLTDGSRWLTLGNFTYCSDFVLNRLVSGVQTVEGIELGLRDLSPTAASILSRLETQFVFLTGLGCLREATAGVLGKWPLASRPIRHLRIAEPISERSATLLVGRPPPIDRCDSPLTVSVPSITLPVAQALSRHTHELYLEVRDEMVSPDIAKVLSGHGGYSLTLDCACGFSDETLQALFGNPGKRTRKVSQRNRVYVVDHEMWSSCYEDDHFPCELH